MNTAASASGAIESVPCYAVVGNPVAHSLSPEIHAAFARQTGMPVDYRRLLAPLDGFVETVGHFFNDGGRGVNVTVPFKLEAFALCHGRLSARALRAGAVNWIGRDEAPGEKSGPGAGPAPMPGRALRWDDLRGDNTDGIGLVTDLTRLLETAGEMLQGSRILLVGAGGAARGVLGPLLDERPGSLVIVNRDRGKAEALVASCQVEGAVVEALAFAALGDAKFDVIVNATSASLGGEALNLPASAFADAGLAYDMMYAVAPTAFMIEAGRGGARAVADGLGMLVEQAAESFLLWRGVRPQTTPVRERLRAMLAANNAP